MAKTKVKAASPVGARRRQQRMKFLLLAAIAFFFLVIGVGAWWLISQNESTELRSQASVDFQTSLKLEPAQETNANRQFQVVLTAQSDQVVPTAFSGVLTLTSPGGGTTTAMGLPAGHRLLAENESWIISTPLENAVTFEPVALAPTTATDPKAPATRTRNGAVAQMPTVKATEVKFTARATNGSTTLKGQKPVVTITLKNRSIASDGWAKYLKLSKPSVRGYLSSAPGAEMELLVTAAPAAQNGGGCLAVIKKCPVGSTNQTSSEYPCGACVSDETGKLVNPVVTQPSPKATPKPVRRFFNFGNRKVGSEVKR